jgi:hypothetical protein
MLCAATPWSRRKSFTWSKLISHSSRADDSKLKINSEDWPVRSRSTALLNSSSGSSCALCTQVAQWNLCPSPERPSRVPLPCSIPPAVDPGESAGAVAHGSPSSNTPFADTPETSFRETHQRTSGSPPASTALPALHRDTAQAPQSEYPAPSVLCTQDKISSIFPSTNRARRRLSLGATNICSTNGALRPREICDAWPLRTSADTWLRGLVSPKWNVHNCSSAARASVDGARCSPKKTVQCIVLHLNRRLSSSFRWGRLWREARLTCSK